MSGRYSGAVRYIFKGDQAQAKRYIGIAQKYIGNLVENMEGQGWNRILSDGTKISMRVAGGIINCTIETAATESIERGSLNIALKNNIESYLTLDYDSGVFSSVFPLETDKTLLDTYKATSIDSIPCMIRDHTSAYPEANWAINVGKTRTTGVSATRYPGFKTSGDSYYCHIYDLLSDPVCAGLLPDHCDAIGIFPYKYNKDSPYSGVKSVISVRTPVYLWNPGGELDPAYLYLVTGTHAISPADPNDITDYCMTYNGKYATWSYIDLTVRLYDDYPYFQYLVLTPGFIPNVGELYDFAISADGSKFTAVYNRSLPVESSTEEYAYNGELKFQYAINGTIDPVSDLDSTTPSTITIDKNSIEQLVINDNHWFRGESISKSTQNISYPGSTKVVEEFLTGSPLCCADNYSITTTTIINYASTYTYDEQLIMSNPVRYLAAVDYQDNNQIKAYQVFYAESNEHNSRGASGNLTTSVTTGATNSTTESDTRSAYSNSNGNKASYSYLEIDGIKLFDTWSFESSMTYSFYESEDSGTTKAVSEDLSIMAVTVLASDIRYDFYLYEETHITRTLSGVNNAYTIGPYDGIASLRKILKVRFNGNTTTLNDINFGERPIYNETLQYASQFESGYPLIDRQWSETSRSSTKIGECSSQDCIKNTYNTVLIRDPSAAGYDYEETDNSRDGFISNPVELDFYDLTLQIMNSYSPETADPDNQSLMYPNEGIAYAVASAAPYRPNILDESDYTFRSPLTNTYTYSYIVESYACNKDDYIVYLKPRFGSSTINGVEWSLQDTVIFRGKMVDPASNTHNIPDDSLVTGTFIG